MNRKSKSSFFLVVIAAMISLAFSTAQAQDIPPACDQYITALKACSAAYIHLLELTQPAQASATKQQLESTVTTLSAQVRTSIRQNGEQVTAERCALPAFKNGVGQGVATIMTLLGFGGGMTNDCQNAWNAIR